MIVFMLLWILASGGLAYFYVTEWHELLMSYCVIEGHTFKEFVMIGGVLHIGILLVIIWGVCMLLLLPKQILASAGRDGGETFCILTLYLLLLGGLIAVIIWFNHNVDPSGWGEIVILILLDILISILYVIIFAPLILGLRPYSDDPEFSRALFITCMFLLLLLCLFLVFLLWAAAWLYVVYPGWSILLMLLALIAVFGGGGSVVYVIVVGS